MTATPISPFGTPAPGLRIKEGSPPLTKPTKEETEAFPAEARALLDQTWSSQQTLLADDAYDLKWIEGRHILLAGATGPGLGGAFAAALLGTGKAASVTILGRDLSRSRIRPKRRSGAIVSIGSTMAWQWKAKRWTS